MSWRGKSPEVTLHGRRAEFILPLGESGIWPVELVTLSGRQLTRSAVHGESGAFVSFDLGMQVEKGVYLVHLTSPNGVTYMLPIVQKN